MNTFSCKKFLPLKNIKVVSFRSLLSICCIYFKTPAILFQRKNRNDVSVVKLALFLFYDILTVTIYKSNTFYIILLWRSSILYKLCHYKPCTPHCHFTFLSRTIITVCVHALCTCSFCIVTPPHFNWWPCLLSSLWFKLFHHSFVTMCHSLSYACVHTYSCLFIFMFPCIVICYQCMVYIYLCTCCHILNCNIQYKLHLLCLNNSHTPLSI